MLDQSDHVIPVKTATNAPLTAIPIGTSSDDYADMELSPDGATLYVLSGNMARGNSQLTAISTATNSAQHPIAIPGVVSGLAISPGGRIAYVTATTGHGWVLVPVNLQTHAVLTPIRLPSRFWAISNVVFTPDGRTAYIAIGSPGTSRGTAVVPIRVATETALAPIRVGLSQPTAIAVSPDGSTVYVSGKLAAGWYKYAVVPIRVGAATPGQPISVPKVPIALVFSR